ncbi:MAG: hypothetical protein M5R36_15915 [Deltaproteobacteria bacterium]|nr:hypothetical protein [Deltaproteobacteria bacterium]
MAIELTTPTARRRRDERWLLATHLTLCALPIIAAAESFARGPAALTFLHDRALPALTMIAAALPYAVYRNVPGGGALIAALAMGGLLVHFSDTFHFAPKKTAGGRAAATAASSTLLLLFFVSWFELCGLRPVVAAALGAVFGPLAFVRRDADTKGPVPELFYLGLAASLAFCFLHLADAVGPPKRTATHLYDKPAYEAAANGRGETVVLSRPEHGLYGTGASWKAIPGTNRPQRVAVDADGVFYLANFLSEGEDSVTVVDKGEAHAIHLRDCRRALDVALDESATRLYVPCETNDAMVAYNRRSDATRVVWGVPAYPYSVVYDKKRGRVLMVTQSGRLYSFDAETMAVLDERKLGFGTWGIALDESRGRVWIARFITGELLVLDADLHLVRRVAVGFAPRDLALDAAARRLYVGHYLSGKVSVVDLDEEKAVDRFRAGDTALAHRLRGVQLAPDDRIFLSDVNGVWAVKRPY